MASFGTAKARRLWRRVPIECRYAVGAGTVLYIAGWNSFLTFCICAVSFQLLKALIERNSQRLIRALERESGVNPSE